MVVWREGQATFRARAHGIQASLPPRGRYRDPRVPGWLAGWLAGRPAVWPSHPERGANHGSRGRWLAGRETSVRPTHVEGRASFFLYLVVAWIFSSASASASTVQWCGARFPCHACVEWMEALIGWWKMLALDPKIRT